MTYSNAQVAEYLTNIATAYEIKHKTQFQIVAYENAAETILTFTKSIYDLWLKNPKELDNIPNIGPSILKKIDYFFKTGKPYPSLRRVFANIHPAVFTFTKINGIGPINAHKLTENLKFKKDPAKALEQLTKYAQNGKIKSIPSFGEKSESSILNNTLAFLGRNQRMPLSTAKKLADKIITYLKDKFPTTEFISLGSLRRQSDTVGDIDIAVASTDSINIINYFIAYPDSVQTIAQGKNKASIRLLHDIHVDLMVKPPQSFGSLLQHFTGSRQHNILLRKHALKLGYSLSEYGIKDIKTGQVHQFDTETKFYNFLKLKFIPPKFRLGETELDKYRQ
jgi:DNA polymerase (family 10)